MKYDIFPAVSPLLLMVIVTVTASASSLFTRRQKDSVRNAAAADMETQKNKGVF